MKRTLSVLAIMMVMVALALASMMPAFAIAGSNANCVGRLASVNNDFGNEFGDHGFGGEFVSEDAQTMGGLSELAPNNCGGR